MFCPQCQAEYRQGFTVCADCDGDLLHSLPTAATLPNSYATQANGIFCPISRGIHQNTCVEICRELKAAGIHYEVTQSVRSHIGMAVEFKYELAVAGDDVKQANELFGLPDILVQNLDLPVEPADDAHGPSPCKKILSTDVTMSRRRTPAARWYPEDAVVQVSEQPEHNKDALVEMSLRENGIPTRAEQLSDGEWAFFVSPEDELQHAKSFARLKALRQADACRIFPSVAPVVLCSKHVLPRMPSRIPRWLHRLCRLPRPSGAEAPHAAEFAGHGQCC